MFGPPTLPPFSSSIALLSPGFSLQLLNLKEPLVPWKAMKGSRVLVLSLLCDFGQVT